MQLNGLISLKDRFSGPMKGATGAMQNFETQAKTLHGTNGKLAASNDKVAKSGKSTMRVFGGLSTSAGGFLSVASGMPAALAGIGAGMAALSSVNLAMDFESQMSTIKALTGASGEEMKQMTDLALEMGAKTKYSALESSRAIEELLKAGLTPATVQAGGLEAALNLATAGGLDLAESAEIMSTAMNAFKADGMEAADAANILAGAANASATSVGELKYGLSMSAAVASGLGLSFADTNTALAVFANNGLKGSDAGTSLKTMLMNLSPATKKAEEQMMDLGLVTEDGVNKFYDAQGNMRSMAEVAGLLQSSLSGLNAEQRTNALRTMFGSDAIRAGNILYKEGADGVKNMYSEMSKVTALDVAKEKMNNAAGAIEQFKGALETMQIVLGTAALPAIKKMALWMAGLLESFQDGGKMSLFTGAIKLVADALYAMREPLGIAAIVIGLTLAISGLSAVFGVLASPVGLVVGAIALLGWGFVTAYKQSEGFRTAIANVATAVKGVFELFKGNTGGGVQLLNSLGLSSETITKIMTAVRVVKETVMNTWTGIKDFVMGLVGQVKTYMETDGAQMFDAVKNAATILAGVFKLVFPVLKWLVMGTFEAIKNVIQGAFNFIMGAVKVFTGIFTGDFGKMWEGIKQMFSGAIQFIWGYVNLLFVGRILKAGKALFVGLKAAAGAGWRGIVNFFKNGISNAGSSVSAGFGKVKKFFADGFAAAKTKTLDGMANIKKTVSTKFDDVTKSVSDWASKLPSKLYDAFAAAVKTLSKIGALVWEQIKDTLPSVSTITDYVTGFFGGGGGGDSAGGGAKSHASGAYRIPKHGYMMKAHAGESVLTAPQADLLRSSGVLTKRNGNMADINLGAVQQASAGGGVATVNINLGGVTIHNEQDEDAFIARIASKMEKAFRG